MQTWYEQWHRRVAQGALGFKRSCWTDVSTLPDFAAWQELARSRGADDSAEGLTYYITRSLLPDLLYAAGGVEHEFSRIEEAIEQTRQLFTQSIEQTRDKGKVSVSAPPLLTATYCFAQLLMWARAVQERVRRSSVGEKGSLGLVPALASGPLKDKIIDARARVNYVLSESRFLANYALHAGAIPGGGTPSAQLLEDGTIKLLLPDPVEGSIATWNEFTYEQERDIVTYGREIWTAVNRFVDEVLSAFEEHESPRTS